MNESDIVIGFNEWLRRYSENPDQFEKLADILAGEHADYGTRCLAYLRWCAENVERAEA